MKKQAFEQFWAKKYPETPPINYLFKHNLPERWVRFHSLPESKRYAETKAEWDILLQRQNDIIDYLISQNAEIKVVINSISSGHFLFQMFDFENIGVLIHDEMTFQSFVTETTWQSGGLNPLLMEIADDSIRAFVIAPDCIVAPYDGGVDVILKNIDAKNELKNIFSDWLSQREDGL